jgi:hypothetical protein
MLVCSSSNSCIHSKKTIQITMNMDDPIIIKSVMVMVIMIFAVATILKDEL